MTPKEKALKLCQDMAYTSMKTDFNEGYTLPLEIAKKCALIAVREMLEYSKESKFPMAGAQGFNYDEYLLEVKTEIEKL